MRSLPYLAGLLLAIGPARALSAAEPPPTQPSAERVAVDFHPLPTRKAVFFAMLAHSNGKIYVGTCYGVARLIEFDPASGRMRQVAKMSSRAEEGGGAKLADPTLKGDLGNGRFPMSHWQFAQDKIHSQLLEGGDGRVYGATHVKVEHIDSTRKYPGGHWFAYDPKSEKVEDLGWARRHEGIITCCLDRERNVLYGITWPTGYLVRCRPGEKEYHKRLNVLDLACSQVDCSPRYMDVVADGRVYFPDGATGDIRMFDPKTQRMYRLRGLTTPTPDTPEPADAKYFLRKTNKWRNWWMVGVRSPDRMHIFFTGQRGGHLAEIDATQGKWGVVVDHGRTVPWAKPDWRGPWCGVMCFGQDGLLYHTVGPQLLSFDMKTGKVLDRGRTVLRSDPSAELRLGAGGTLGPDGKIYCMARHKRQPGVAVLDPSKLGVRKARSLRLPAHRHPPAG